MRRFGPSGSWKKKKSVREQASAVIPRRSNDFFVDVNSIEAVLYRKKYSLAITIFERPCKVEAVL
jgi:hypothetical protein